MHTFTKQAEKFKQTSARKLMAAVFWDRNGGIHATRDHNNIRSVLQNTKETVWGHSEQKAWNTDIWCSTPP
jgi:hypothetical protein